MVLCRSLQPCTGTPSTDENMTLLKMFRAVIDPACSASGPRPHSRKLTCAEAWQLRRHSMPFVTYPPSSSPASTMPWPTAAGTSKSLLQLSRAEYTASVNLLHTSCAPCGLVGLRISSLWLLGFGLNGRGLGLGLAWIGPKGSPIVTHLSCEMLCKLFWASPSLIQCKVTGGGNPPALSIPNAGPAARGLFFKQGVQSKVGQYSGRLFQERGPGSCSCVVHTHG